MLPFVFITLAGLMLLLALGFLWQSFRAAFSAESAFDLPHAEANSRQVLEEKKQALLANLKDLEFDHAGGKIDEKDFKKLRAKLRREAKQVLRLLDQDVLPYRAKAEALLSERLQTSMSYRDDARGEPADDVANETAAPTTEEALRTCQACNTVNDADAAFCKKCGATLAEEAPADKDESEGEGA